MQCKTQWSYFYFREKLLEKDTFNIKKYLDLNDQNFDDQKRDNCDLIGITYFLKKHIYRITCHHPFWMSLVSSLGRPELNNNKAKDDGQSCIYSSDLPQKRKTWRSGHQQDIRILSVNTPTT